MGQPTDLFQQVFAQGAADAAVAHLHQFFFRAIEADVPLYFTAVDVDLAHVVDDHGDAQIVAIAQDVVQQRAFSCAKEAGKNGNGKTVHEGFTRVRMRSLFTL